MRRAMPRIGRAPDDGRDGGPVCERCGALLSTDGLSADTLDKLARLTRIGLRGRDALLRVRRPPEEG